MGSNTLMLEDLQITPIFPGYVTDDLDDDTMQTGDYLYMGNYGKCLILIAYGDGSATTGDIGITVQQTTYDGDTANIKAIDFLQTGRIFEKRAATTVAAVADWVKVTQATADEVYTDTASGEELGMIALELKSSDFDADGGFDWFRVDLTACTSAKLACALAIFGDPKYPAAVTSMKSVIA